MTLTAQMMLPSFPCLTERFCNGKWVANPDPHPHPDPNPILNPDLQEEHPEDAVLDTTGAQAHVYANLRVTTPPLERPLQKRPHSDFVAREAAKEAAGLKGPAEKPGTLPRQMIFSHDPGFDPNIDLNPDPDPSPDLTLVAAGALASHCRTECSLSKSASACSVRHLAMPCTCILVTRRAWCSLLRPCLCPAGHITAAFLSHRSVLLAEGGRLSRKTRQNLALGFPRCG